MCKITPEWFDHYWRHGSEQLFILLQCFFRHGRNDELRHEKRGLFSQRFFAIECGNRLPLTQLPGIELENNCSAIRKVGRERRKKRIPIDCSTSRASLCEKSLYGNRFKMTRTEQWEKNPELEKRLAVALCGEGCLEVRGAAICRRVVLESSNFTNTFHRLHAIWIVMC